jgi:hypothetical protein
MTTSNENFLFWPQQGVICNETFTPFDPALKEGREPIIVHGDLLTPAMLPQEAPILFQRGRLHESDVVFSSSQDINGNFLTSLRHIQGTVVQVGVVWVSTNEKTVLFQNTALVNVLRKCRFDHISLGLDDGQIVNRAWTFLPGSYHITVQDRPLAHSGHPASKRFLPSMNQSEIKSHISKQVKESDSLSTWVFHNSVEPLEWALISEES